MTHTERKQDIHNRIAKLSHQRLVIIQDSSIPAKCKSARCAALGSLIDTLNFAYTHA